MPSKLSTAWLILTLAFGLLAGLCVDLGGIDAAAATSAPDTDNGRYALSPVADGILRLDTRTGAVSSCSNSGSGWTCTVMPDERAALDDAIGRLQADNERLKAELLARQAAAAQKVDEQPPPADSLKKAEPKLEDNAGRIEIPLPADRDIDRAMSVLEQAWRRLVEMANRMQRDFSGRI